MKSILVNHIRKKTGEIGECTSDIPFIHRMRRDRGSQTPQTFISPRFTEQHVYANEATAEIEMKPNNTSPPDYETTETRGSTYEQPDSFYEPLKIEN